MRVVWQVLAVAAVAFIGGQVTMMAKDNWWLTLIVGLVTGVVAVPVYRWVVGRTERREVTELARAGSASATVLGALFGAVLFGLVILNLVFLGSYQVNGLGSPTSALGLFGFMVAVAVTEELLYRGLLFRIVEEYAGTWISLLLGCALFGLGHLLNPNADLWGAVLIAVTGGGMLTAAYIATRSLWLPIGLHFGWNLAASAIFGTEVSGNDTPPGLVDSTLSGPDLVTGGDLGPEGSVYTLVFCSLVTVALLWFAHRRGRLVPRRRADRVAPTATLSR